MITVDYFIITRALGKAFGNDYEELYWRVIHELNEVYPQLSWENAISDGFKDAT